jgi:hypothetical protein
MFLLKKLALLFMPYYRIVVWTKKRIKPFVGIREIENHNITSVLGMVKKKAENVYHSNLIDVEVQMLAKTCTAVQKFIEKKNK